MPRLRLVLKSWLFKLFKQCNKLVDVAIVMNIDTGEVLGVPVGFTPVGIAFNPHKGNMYVTSQNSNTVSRIEILTNTVVVTMHVKSSPHGIDFNPTMDACVTNDGSGTVSIYTATNTVVATFGLISISSWHCI
jgi:YVTN family beta-propeller protein